MTNYKDVTQKYLDESFNPTYDYVNGSDHYDKEHWQQLLFELDQSIESNNISSLETVYDYYLNHKNEDSLTILCQSGIPIKLCLLISNPERSIFFENNSITQNKSKKELGMALYLISKACQSELFTGLSLRMKKTFFEIYLTDKKQASNLSISIFSHIVSHPEIINHLSEEEEEDEDDYQEQILNKIVKPHSILSRIFSLYALFSYLPLNDFDQNSLILDTACHVFQNSGNCRLLLATIQLLDLFLDFYHGSEKSLNKANKLDLIQIIIEGLTTSSYEDDEMLSTLRNTSFCLLDKILHSGYLEFNHEIREKQLIKNVGLLLDHVSIPSDINCGADILFSLLNIGMNPTKESDLVFPLDQVIPEIIQYAIIEKLLNCVEDMQFGIKAKIFQIFSLLILIKCDIALQLIRESGICNEMIAALDFLSPPSSILILESLQFLIQNIEDWTEYFDVTELTDILFALKENEHISANVQLLIKLLSLE